ncbi:hypothetical protein [Butyrivibrio sp. INlla14]|uniref:hypothetical protein n=1 Tax=Butyrivibrio sp. INlla14 TaxID=1520808 RepID=UPI000B806727|nr:hypothetical protein [Butyrivibrio sp. INlla14]
MAYLFDSIALSSGKGRWDYPFIDIFKGNSIVGVRNAYSEDNLKTHKDWLENKTPIVLEKCKIEPKNEASGMMVGTMPVL